MNKHELDVGQIINSNPTTAHLCETGTVAVSDLKTKYTHRSDREQYVRQNSRNNHNRTNVEPLPYDTYRTEFGIKSGAVAPLPGTFSPTGIQLKRKFDFRRVNDSAEAIAAKKASAQFSKNGLTVIKNTRVLSMSPSRALMSLDRQDSYAHLMRIETGQPSSQDGWGSKQGSLNDLHSPGNFKAPVINAAVLGDTAGSGNRDIGLDLTDDKMGLTFFTAGQTTPRQSRASNDHSHLLHNYN